MKVNIFSFENCDNNTHSVNKDLIKTNTTLSREEDSERKVLVLFYFSYEERKISKDFVTLSTKLPHDNVLEVL